MLKICKRAFQFYLFRHFRTMKPLAFEVVLASRTDMPGNKHVGERGCQGAWQQRLAKNQRWRSASSSTSTQCRTGVPVPLCRWVMQPMLAERIMSGGCSPKASFSTPSLRSRSW